MKFIVLSDSHGIPSNITEALKLHPDAEALLFLGDGLNDLKCVTSLPVIAVRGNCDSFLSKEPTLQTLTADGVRICLIHGHEQGVKGSDSALYSLGESYDLILHGHTHVFRDDRITVDGRTVGICNPGAARMGRYGILYTKDGNFLFSGGNLR